MRDPFERPPGARHSSPGGRGRGIGLSPSASPPFDRPARTTHVREERWRHERRWVRCGVTVALPRGFTVGASAELHETGYEDTGGELRFVKLF